MEDGVVPTGPTDEEFPHSITRTPAEASEGGVSTRLIVLVVLTTALVLDLLDVLPVPIEDLLPVLLSVL